MANLILHIDEHPQLPDGVAETLESEGYEILVEADPEEVMRLVQEREPALVLIEFELEECNGPHLLDGIRSVSKVPVLVLTTAPRSSPLHGEAIALGAADFITKPGLASHLITQIRELAPPAPPEPPEPEPEPEPTQSEPAATAAPKPGAEPRPQPWSPPGLSGDLSTTPLPELLARLRRRGASGVLLANFGDARLAVQLRNGSPVAVSSNRWLVPKLDDDTQRSEEEVAAVIAERAEAALFEGFSWTEGSYRFTERGRIKPDTALATARDPARMILDGVLAASPLPLVRDRLHKLASLYVSDVEPAEGEVEKIELTSAQERLLAQLSGEATLEDILASNAFDERLLYGLWVAGRLELDNMPTLSLLDEVGAPAEEARDEEKWGEESRYEEPRDEERTEEAPVASTGTAIALPIDPAEVLERTLRALSQRVLAVDDFEALDVPLFATDGQVRSAYERILAEIPEEAFESANVGIRERATRIRDRIQAAHDHLIDPEIRRAYALLRQEKEQDGGTKASAARALEAESWFRKGGRFLKSKRYDEAAEAFGMASHLDPGEGEYLANLGYAMFLAKPAETVVQREAMEHIANGIKRSPDREMSYVYLGRILRAKGEVDTARNVFKRALRIRPDCHPAQQELRLLNLRDQKSKGLFSKLLKR